MTKTKKHRMGKNMKRALTFISGCGGWIGYAKHDRPVVSAIKKLEDMGLVETNEFHQFRLVRD